MCGKDMTVMGIVRSKYYGIIRGVTVGISFFLQIALMIFLGMYLLRYSVIAYFMLEIVSVITVFALVNDAESYKMSWIVIILVLPVSGLFLYLRPAGGDLYPDHQTALYRRCRGGTSHRRDFVRPE